MRAGATVGRRGRTAGDAGGLGLDVHGDVLPRGDEDAHGEGDGAGARLVDGAEAGLGRGRGPGGSVVGRGEDESEVGRARLDGPPGAGGAGRGSGGGGANHLPAGGSCRGGGGWGPHQKLMLVVVAVGAAVTLNVTVLRRSAEVATFVTWRGRERRDRMREGESKAGTAMCKGAAAGCRDPSNEPSCANLACWRGALTSHVVPVWRGEGWLDSQRGGRNSALWGCNRHENASTACNATACRNRGADEPSQLMTVSNPRGGSHSSSRPRG